MPILATILIKHVHSSYPYRRPIHQKEDQQGVNCPSGYGALVGSGLESGLELVISGRFYSADSSGYDPAIGQLGD